MKKIFLFVVFALISITTQAQEVKWMTMKDAIAAQKKNKKPIFIDAYTVWCGPCKMLDQNTFSDAKVAKLLNEKYNPVKFNSEGNEEIQFGGKLYKNPNYQEARKNSRNGMHEFTEFLKVPGYPTMSVINAKGTIEKSIVGYKSAEELISLL
ncbi:thioredoxin fold domain-containing protein [Flavobacterium sp. xlx-214]|uniref:thioredoxin family protein n=1 Tax=unclassified Flavobacterium TaxID=196869 RepID=UPI0013D8B0D8|nr:MULTISPECIES: thioredoxin fold domain-containing protein [unclassified Flavobacterium]MBA5791215.1 thioredoxin fold domain-containing protein [Flavobacterium sp. xlx-221]QMI83617.1 thioredoxin fold domain-containing protein [Flavobacterium sp. xlx-214]